MRILGLVGVGSFAEVAVLELVANMIGEGSALGARRSALASSSPRSPNGPVPEIQWSVIPASPTRNATPTLPAHAVASIRANESTTTRASPRSTPAPSVALASGPIPASTARRLRASLLEPLLTTEAISHATPSRRTARSLRKREEPADLSNFDCRLYL